LKTELPAPLLATPEGRRADEILRSCVHCGFCNATCPTYQLLGDELDGPRGRIYLIKELLESNGSAEVTSTHLDRCLTCRACETTCPSGVAYGELLEIGRGTVEATLKRGIVERIKRRWLVNNVANVAAFRRWMRLARLGRWLLPRRVKTLVPKRQRSRPIEASNHTRKVVLLNGCVQQLATPEVNATLAELLDTVGIQCVTADNETCCGGLALHLADDNAAMETMRNNVDALFEVAQGSEAILSTASGCGVTIKDYGRLLASDPLYTRRAEWVAARTRDVSEYLARHLAKVAKVDGIEAVAWQAPCTLQHGQQLTRVVESILRRAGYRLVSVRDPHLCCGSAGTYSILQPKLSAELRARKLEALLADQPDVIATANVGCQTHLAGATKTKVVHWLELIRPG
jgi:glycolate oxidase iron-sulfur subunit